MTVIKQKIVPHLWFAKETKSIPSKANQVTYPVGTMCSPLGVSPSGYHAWKVRPPSVHSDVGRVLVSGRGISPPWSTKEDMRSGKGKLPGKSNYPKGGNCFPASA